MPYINIIIRCPVNNKLAFTEWFVTNEKPEIDPYLFECHFQAFKSFVESQSRVAFNSFASNPFTLEQEGYKSEIYKIAHEKLVYQAWQEADVGKGEIISSIIEAIEIPDNNLVQWQSIYGEKSRPHQRLYEAQQNSNQCKLIETRLFRLYHSSDDAKSFNQLIDFLGKKYSLIAYLYFIKDKSKYLPIAPTVFDRAFEILGVNFKTSRHCSWENYTSYINIISELKTMLVEIPINEVTLLDAHSFAWMLARQMEKANKLANVTEYESLSVTERDAVIKARVGQGQFRNSLISYWSTCALTGCVEQSLLRASHIKPWSRSNLSERLSLYNGLLLSPNIDTCFDSGLISFNDSGNIMISKHLTIEDSKSLGIHKSMKLSKIEEEHKKYLHYHRSNIFKKES